jgi:hypothetical protein
LELTRELKAKGFHSQTSAVLVKGQLEVVRDHLRGASLDVVPLNHVHEQSSIFEKRDARGARGVGQHELSRSIDSVFVHSGKGGGFVVWQFAVLQGELDTRSHGSGGATAHAVEHDEASYPLVSVRCRHLQR